MVRRSWFWCQYQKWLKYKYETAQDCYFMVRWARYAVVSQKLYKWKWNEQAKAKIPYCIFFDDHNGVYSEYRIAPYYEYSTNTVMGFCGTSKVSKALLENYANWLNTNEKTGVFHSSDGRRL